MATTVNTTENPEHGISAGNLFPLDTPEFAVRIRSGEKIFRHVFRRATAADWEACRNNLPDETTNGGECEAVNSDREDAADLLLYERIILRVEGYLTRDGRVPQQLPNWPNCIPLEHRLCAIRNWWQCFGQIDKRTFQAVKDNTVCFIITRDETEGDPLRDYECFGVAHHFRGPNADHVRRFLSAASTFGHSTRILVPLYDELVVSAEGYSIAGLPIAPEQLRGEMLPYHKAFAVLALFLWLSSDDPDPLKKKPLVIPENWLGTKRAAPPLRMGMC